MSLVPQKKSYLVCVEDEFSNIHETYAYFFFQEQKWDSQQRAETAAWKKNITLYFENLQFHHIHTYQITFLMTCQQHWSWFQAELERIEAERLAKEEEEERLAMEEAERLGAEARRAEEERLQKAIEEAQKREVRPVFSQNYILWQSPTVY